MKKIVSMMYVILYVFNSICSSHETNVENRENDTKQIICRKSSKAYALQVTNSTTIREIKEMLKDRDLQKNKYIKIIWAGKPLKDNDTVGSAKIPHDSTVEFLNTWCPFSNW